MNPPSLTIFFPCYNDGRSIPALVKKAAVTAGKLTSKYEIIVVNDGSTDSSLAVLQKLSRKIPELRILSHRVNLGYGAALKSGFAAARYSLVFYTDGDSQYDPRHLIFLWPLMTPGVHFVNGIKLSRHDASHRIVLGNLYSFLARWLFWLPISDVDCDFRLIRKSLLKKLHLTSTSGSICVELVKKAQLSGGVFRQVSIPHYLRPYGHSQFFHPHHLLTTLKELSLLWLNLILFKKP